MAYHKIEDLSPSFFVLRERIMQNVANEDEWFYLSLFADINEARLSMLLVIVFTVFRKVIRDFPSYLL
jgi:hypothetical protein